MDATANGSGRRPGSGRRRRGPTRTAMRIVVVYAVVAGLWIVASDTLSRALTIDPNMLTLVGIGKGVLFVAVTSGLLYIQIRQDLADLQKSADQLRESEERFRSIIAVSPVPMTMSDGAENVTLMNDAFTQALGYTRDDIPTLDRWWPVAYPDPEYRRSVMDAWDREIERSRVTGEAFRPLEARIRTKEGAERTILLSSAALGGASSEQVVAFWDITERERADAAVVRSNERLERVLRSITALIGKVVEARDPYTQGHEQGVARIGRQIAEEMGLPAKEVEAIEVAALVHDVGKLSVPAEILTKPGTLSETEFQLIRVHSQGGYEILKDIDFDWPVADIVVQHHERMDGSGYPAGLAGDEISVAARVLMVADVIEAMAAHRPYRPALGLQAAMDEITTHPEKFDPQVTAAGMRLWERGAFDV